MQSGQNLAFIVILLTSRCYATDDFYHLFLSDGFSEPLHDHIHDEYPLPFFPDAHERSAGAVHAELNPIPSRFNPQVYQDSSAWPILYPQSTPESLRLLESQESARVLAGQESWATSSADSTGINKRKGDLLSLPDYKRNKPTTLSFMGAPGDDQFSASLHAHNHASYQHSPSTHWNAMTTERSQTYETGNLELLASQISKANKNGPSAITDLRHETLQTDGTSESTEPLHLDFDVRSLPPIHGSLSKTEDVLRQSFKEFFKDSKPLRIYETNILSESIQFSHEHKKRFAEELRNENVAWTPKKLNRQLNNMRQKILTKKWKFLKKHFEVWYRYFAQQEIPNFKYYTSLAKGNTFFGNLFPYYLIYVEMINQIVPQENQVMNPSSELREACHLFWKLAHSLDPESKSTKDILTEEEKTESGQKMSYFFLKEKRDQLKLLQMIPYEHCNNEMSSSWKLLEFWIRNSRPTLMVEVQGDKYPSNINTGVKGFFNSLFSVTIEGLTEKLSNRFK